jgi:hypothetical protein
MGASPFVITASLSGFRYLQSAGETAIYKWSRGPDGPGWEPVADGVRKARMIHLDSAIAPLLT